MNKHKHFKQVNKNRARACLPDKELRALYLAYNSTTDSQIPLIIENNKNGKIKFDQYRDHAPLIQRIILRPVTGLPFLYFHQNHCQKHSRVFENSNAYEARKTKHK